MNREAHAGWPRGLRRVLFVLAVGVAVAVLQLIVIGLRERPMSTFRWSYGATSVLLYAVAVFFGIRGSRLAFFRAATALAAFQFAATSFGLAYLLTAGFDAAWPTPEWLDLIGRYKFWTVAWDVVVVVLAAVLGGYLLLVERPRLAPFDAAATGDRLTGR